MVQRFLGIGVALLVVGGSAASAASISMGPSKDNTIIQPAIPSQSNPSGQLSNGAGDLLTGRTNQDGQEPAVFSIRRGLVAYDIAGNVPSGATITGVTLVMRDVMGLNGDPVVELHRALQDWGEGTSFQNGGTGAATQNDATWLYRFFNAADYTTSPTWSTPGGNFSSTVSGSAIISDDLGAGQLFTWSSASNSQMVVDVQSWLDNPSGNFGWLLRGDESKGQTVKRLNSKEGTTSPSVHPLLTVTYMIPEPSTASLAILAALGLCLVGSRRRPLARL